MAQLLDIVYLENCRHEDAESEASSTTVTMMHPHTLIIFWEKLSSLVKENCLGRRGTSTISSSSEAEVHQEEVLNHRLATTLNDTILALPQYHPGQIRNIAFAIATIVKDIGGVSINDRHSNRRNGRSAGGRQGNTMHDVDLRMILYNQLVTSRNATVFWDMVQQQVLLQSMDNYRPKWLVSIAWSLATMSESIRKHHHQQQQQQQ
jgi:hypothetical protein